MRIILLFAFLILIIGCKKTSNTNQSSVNSGTSTGQAQNIKIKFSASCLTSSKMNWGTSLPIDSVCCWWLYKGSIHWRNLTSITGCYLMDSLSVNSGDTIKMQIISYVPYADTSYTYLNQFDIHAPSQNKVITLNPTPQCYPNCTYFSFCNYADQVRVSNIFTVKIQ